MKTIMCSMLAVSITFALQAAQTSENNDRLKAALRRFPEADTNKDGVLTPDEFPQKNLFRLGDVDKDGKLTKPEFLRAYKMQFKRAHDKNGDGFISGDEIK